MKSNVIRLPAPKKQVWWEIEPKPTKLKPALRLWRLWRYR